MIFWNVFPIASYLEQVNLHHTPVVPSVWKTHLCLSEESLAVTEVFLGAQGVLKIQEVSLNQWNWTMVSGFSWKTSVNPLFFEDWEIYPLHKKINNNKPQNNIPQFTRRPFLKKPCIFSSKMKKIFETIIVLQKRTKKQFWLSFFFKYVYVILQKSVTIKKWIIAMLS